MAQYYVGVDVGGTTVKMGMFSDTGELLDKWEIPTRRKNNGEYILLSKFEDDVVFEYHITIQEEDFNLGILKMKTPEGEFVADFDA